MSDAGIMSGMLAGHATSEGASRYVQQLAGRIPAEHFRELPGGVRVSTIGLGTYLGREDDATDALYQKAIAGSRAVSSSSSWPKRARM